MRFGDDFIARVRAANDIVALVSDYVSLKKVGPTWKGLCCFHSEKTASLVVHGGDQQYFICFGCQTSGDAISFVRELHGYSFTEAIKYLANRAGLELPQAEHESNSEAPREPKVSREVLDDLYGIHRVAQRFYQDTLHTASGARCASYLRSRGIEQVSVSRFGLGCAPDSWDGFFKTIEPDPRAVELAFQAGLLGRKETTNGLRYYDRFRNRLMFPIKNLAGDVIAFSGRLIPGESETTNPEKPPAKYINSPETPIYKKGETLYGLREARPSMRAHGLAVLVEGNLDLVKLHQEGCEHVVAPLGTALTKEQCRIVKRFVDRAIAIYDGDHAGREASRKAVELAISEDLRLDIVALPDGEDPDSIITAAKASSHGLNGTIPEMLAMAQPGWEYLVARTIDETGAETSVQGAKVAIERLSPILATIDAKARPMFERTISSKLGINGSDVSRIARGVAPKHKPEPKTEIARPDTPPPDLELTIVVCLLSSMEARALFLGYDMGSTLSHAGVRDAAHEICSCEGPMAEAIGAISDSGIKNALVLRSEKVRGDYLAEFKKWVAIHQQQHQKRKRQAVLAEIANTADEVKALALYQSIGVRASLVH